MLTVEEIELCIQSLEYTRQRLANYDGYPSYEYKQARIAEVNATIKKLRAMRKEVNT